MTSETIELRKRCATGDTPFAKKGVAQCPGRALEEEERIKTEMGDWKDGLSPGQPATRRGPTWVAPHWEWELGAPRGAHSPLGGERALGPFEASEF